MKARCEDDEETHQDKTQLDCTDNVCTIYVALLLVPHIHLETFVTLTNDIL